MDVAVSSRSRSLARGRPQRAPSATRPASSGPSASTRTLGGPSAGTLGGPSAKVLLKTTEGILRLRGNWRVHVTPGGVSIPTMPTLHPAYLLRTPAHKKLAWRDLLEVKAKLRSEVPPP